MPGRPAGFAPGKSGSRQDRTCGIYARLPLRQREGLPMHMITIMAAGFALALSVAANAQVPSDEPLPDEESALSRDTPSARLKNPSVIIVDISALPKAKQSQVNQFVAQRGDSELQKLRTAIDATPNIKTKLKAKGLSSMHVLIVQTNANGRLTLITNKKI
jgi:hypothetical protein